MDQYESISARENMFPKERSFLELLAYGKDKRQKYQVIKFIKKSQYYFFVENCNKYIARNNTSKKTSIESFEEFKNINKKISRRKSGKFRFSSSLYEYKLYC